MGYEDKPMLSENTYILFLKLSITVFKEQRLKNCLPNLGIETTKYEKKSLYFYDALMMMIISVKGLHTTKSTILLSNVCKCQ